MSSCPDWFSDSFTIIHEHRDYLLHGGRNTETIFSELIWFMGKTEKLGEDLEHAKNVLVSTFPNDFQHVWPYKGIHVLSSTMREPFDEYRAWKDSLGNY